MTRFRITPQEVEKAARLLGMELSDEEVAAFVPQLTRALKSLEAVTCIEVATVEPTSCVSFIDHNVWRDDRPREGLGVEETLQLAARSREGYFLVPPVAKGDG